MKNLRFTAKKEKLTMLCMAFFLLATLMVSGQQNPTPPYSPKEKFVHQGAGNPYLPLWEHLPDGEPRVFEDPDNPGKYRAYIIGSHDLRLTSYCGPDIRMWSAPVEDLSQWRDEGAIFTYQVDDQWDVMYAPDLVEVRKKDGTKEYYLYPHSRGPRREAMVAKGNRPDGPFTPINLTEDGRSTIPGSILGFDPAVYIEYVTDPADPDYEIGFRAYGYWGFQRSLAAQLDQNTMYSLRPGTEVISYFIPASARYGMIRDPEGTQYPQIYPDQDLKTFNFFEASSIRKVGNKYVTVFSGYSGPEYGVGSSNSTLRYAVGDSPLGPWRSGGVLVDSRAPVLNRDGSAIETSYAGHNTHGSIELINDQWYVFYHRPPRGFGFARQPMVAPIKVEWDEKPVSEGGMVTISAYDPYANDQKWSAKDSNGKEYKGAEVTSEGFHIYGLDPYQYYSAGYASYLSDISIQQDAWDIWNNHMPIGNVKDGHVIGYKYFGFGGLKKDTKGLKAFKGTKKRNKTAFNLFLTPKTSKSFKVNVWLDGPWKNEAWKGTKIGEILVPANSSQETTQFTIDVSKYVDHLDRKHAIFLVAEGDKSTELFDLIGLGFSSKKKKIAPPVVPTVTIAVNGKELELPKHPVRSTNANGIVGYNLYEATCELPAGTTTPTVTATADNKKVKVNVIQADSPSGIAKVEFDFNGVVKTYQIQFETQKEEMHVYLCLGQSNMEGHVRFKPEDTTGIDDRFMVLQSVDCPDLGRVKGEWYKAIPPLVRCHTGLGPVDFFGRKMTAELPSHIKVGVINVAVGGCKIELFDKENFQDYVATSPNWLKNMVAEYDGNPYQRLVDMALVARQNGGVIKGILLHQGESNTGEKDWPLKVKKVYDSLLKDVGLAPNSVPLLAGEVVHADQGGVCASMNEIIQTLPEVIPNSHVISSAGCKDGPDNLHFSTEGYKMLGERYADQMLSILNK